MKDRDNIFWNGLGYVWIEYTKIIGKYKHQKNWKSIIKINFNQIQFAIEIYLISMFTFNAGIKYRNVWKYIYAAYLL